MTIETRTEPVPPEVGIAATLIVGSDCYPMRVVEIRGKRVTVARIEHYEAAAVIEFRDTGGYGWDKTIDVTHPTVHLGGREVYTLRKNGRYVREGEGQWGLRIVFGHAKDYRDPHF